MADAFEKNRKSNDAKEFSLLIGVNRKRSAGGQNDWSLIVSQKSARYAVSDHWEADHLR